MQSGKTIRRVLVLLAICALLPYFAFSSVPMHDKSYELQLNDNRLRVFLDFPGWADFHYVRLNIPFVEYVRDTELADVHILMSRHNAGQTGSNYVISFIGLGPCSNMKNELKFWSQATQTEREIREAYTDMIKIGLAPYVANRQKSPKNLKVVYEFDSLGTYESAANRNDPWNSWVFEIYGGGYYRAEQTRKSLHIRYGFFADKITKDWRIRARPYFNINRDKYAVADSSIIAYARRDGFDGYLIRSIDNHWSAGVFSYMLSATYYNMDFQIQVSPAVQYSFFPYSEAMRRSITLAYKLDFEYNDYIEETIFGKNKESLIGHSLVLATDFLQTWGRVRGGMTGSHHFHNFKSNRLEFFTQLDLRIFKGLSLSLNANYDLINDLVAIPSGQLTTEEILLEIRRRATNYQFFGHIGFTYTFGSELSSDYNPRLIL